MEKNNVILNISEALKEKIDFWFRYNNISREKINLFYDFIISLDDLIDKTYLGAELLNDETKIKGHFVWCWKKTVENFSKERIFFKEYGDHFEYLWNFYNEAYYIQKLINKEIIIHDYYYKIFDLTHQKTEIELEILHTLYKIFNQNLKR
jgi:hypothetical protein